jgi:hypothetical protein
MSKYPIFKKNRPNIDLRLGIKSSLPNVKYLLGTFLILSSLEKSTIQYTEEYTISRKTMIRMSDILKRDIITLFKGIEIDENLLFLKFNESPLFRSQLEALQVTLGSIYKLCNIQFTSGMSVTKERTGGERFNKIIHFSLNNDLLIIDYLLSKNSKKEFLNLLYSWVVSNEHDHKLLENVLIKKLTIFTEDTIFKIRDKQNQEILFQQEGIYEHLINNLQVIASDNKEPVGPLRVLKTIIKDNLHYFITGQSEWKAKQGKSSELKNYYQRLEVLLDLKQSKEVVYQDVLIESIDLKPNIEVSAPQNQIFFGAPGTGKSHKIETEILKGVPEEQQERITFHPDYDNASFVGSYMPESDSNGNITYQFVAQVFTNIYVKAWQNLDKPYFLVIEEINRGNCAEIFGDIFQLLDRTSNYAITPKSALQKYLIKELKEKGLEGIKNGKMILPPNLQVLATMNTSDQSLFPMDSAFKRRWAWKYVPINYDRNEANLSASFAVRLDENHTFSWLDFIEKVNLNYIKNNENLGEDKCIGNYFIKPNDTEISLEEFINKVIFYLWNDVFKDEEETPFENGKAYSDFFPESTKGKDLVEAMLTKLEIKTNDSSETSE